MSDTKEVLPDIVDRLRGGVFGLNRLPLCEEAATVISELRAEVERLKMDVKRWQLNYAETLDETVHAARAGASGRGGLAAYRLFSLLTGVEGCTLSVSFSSEPDKKRCI